MSDFRLAGVRAKVAALESGGRADAGVLPFGERSIDQTLPGGGLPLGRWHEITGAGLEAEVSAAPAAFAALMAAPLARRGEAVWVLRRDDLWAPGLAGLGFPPERLIQVCARDEAETLMGHAGRPGHRGGLRGVRRGRGRGPHRRAAAAAGLRKTREHRLRHQAPPLWGGRPKGGHGLGGRHPLARGPGALRTPGRGLRPGRAALPRRPGALPRWADRRMDLGGP